MAPIALPLPHARVTLPSPPHDPPSHQDVAAAHLYIERAEIAFKANNVPHAVLSDAITYQANIISAKLSAAPVAEGVAPPNWLQPALQQIREDIQTVKTELQASLDTSINQLRMKLTSIERTGAMSYNMSVADGQNFSFKRVPFPDGSDPVTEHELPPLDTTHSIRVLSDNDLKVYYIRYVGPVGNRNKETQIKGVCKAIGATQ